MQNPPDKDSDLYEIYMTELASGQNETSGPENKTTGSRQNSGEQSAWGPLDSLPGNPMMWVLIISELMVFGLLLTGYSVNFIMEPDLFRESQAQLSRQIGGLNTLVLITSGLFAALANEASKENRLSLTRRYLLITACFGILFLALKLYEYSDKAALGISIETNSFYTLFYLMTGFHAAHVIFGLAILGLVSRYSSRENIQTACSFWHMVDLIWLILYPVLYLVR
ncbi:cytochrome c oxidase subunit 3 family protein [Kiloniella laminariae]|uniref:cytochrome c oxidase subunit 3 family protein n=1 Tax=Kiloniella laminariae TaxID=454162 RepID=UPI0003744E27|nr:cytochrome c oxidase subunit 3 family protein [Kiloniella laminariae]